MPLLIHQFKLASTHLILRIAHVHVRRRKTRKGVFLINMDINNATMSNDTDAESEEPSKD